jgi:hypothetical protein
MPYSFLLLLLLGLLPTNTSQIINDELERLRRIVSGNWDRNQYRPGLAFESGMCRLDDLNCSCALYNDATTTAVNCGKDHVLCSVAFASYGTIRGVCGASSLHSRSLQEGQCKTNDMRGSISARSVVLHHCRGRQHCLLNRCMMQPPDAQAPACIQSTNKDVSWGVIFTKCVPKHTCPQDAGSKEVSLAPPNNNRSLILATTLQNAATPLEFSLSPDAYLKQRLKACPHVSNCPSCVCIYEPQTVVATVMPTIVHTHFNHPPTTIKLWLESISQLPIIPHLTIVSSMPHLLTAEFIALTELEKDYSTTKKCGGSFLPIELRINKPPTLLLPLLNELNETSISNLVKVTISEGKTKTTLSEIKILIESPPIVRFDVNSMTSASTTTTVDDNIITTCSLTVGLKSLIEFSTSGVSPTSITARSGQPQTLPDDKLELHQMSSVQKGSRDWHKHRLHATAYRAGMITIHVAAIDGNGVKTTETLTCRAREPPIITVLDSSPIMVTVGFAREIRYVVAGHPPLQLQVTSRVAKVLTGRHLKYAKEIMMNGTERNTEQRMIISAPTKAQVGTTSFNMSIVDGNGARTESVDVICKIIAQPIIVLKDSTMFLTQDHTKRRSIEMNGYNIKTLEVTSSDPKVLPDTMVMLQRNDDESYELHVTGKMTGITKISFAAVDGNGARSAPVILQVTVFAPPTIEILDQRNIVVVHVLGTSKGIVRGTDYVEALVTGLGPIDIVALSSNLDVINPAKGHLVIVGSGERRKITVRTSQDQLGSAVIRCVATDVNGASVSVDFQVDVIKQKAKSKHQLWQERNRDP